MLTRRGEIVLVLILIGCFVLTAHLEWRFAQ
jgi:hypothetical protein